MKLHLKVCRLIAALLVTLSINPLAMAEIASSGAELAARAAAMEAAGKIDLAAKTYLNAGVAYQAAGDAASAGQVNLIAAGLYEKEYNPPAKRPTQPNTATNSAALPSDAAIAFTSPQLPPLAMRPGYVIGRAIFEDGRPVPNFSVSVAGSDGQAGTGSLGSIAAHNGLYALQTKDTFSNVKPVNALVTGVDCTAMIDYRGQHYQIAMCPVDGQVSGTEANEFHGDSGPGVVRDFVLKLGAIKPGSRPDEFAEAAYKNSCYGGRVMVSCALSRGKYPVMPDATSLSQVVPADSRVTVTLTPAGPLIDGSLGQPFIQTFAMNGPWKGFYLRGIPLGFYTATATVTEPNGVPHALQLSLKPTDAPVWRAAVPIEFPLSQTFADGSDEVALYLGR